jgi:integrase
MHEAIFVATESNHVHPGKGKIRRSLPLDCWPEADRNAWNAACQPAARLKRGGVAGHLKPATRENHAWLYGAFLGFLNRSGLLRSEGPAAANVTADNINVYLADLKGRVGSVTVHSWICTLRRAAQYIAPDRGFTWLSEIGKDLALVAVPRSKFDRVVLSEVLVEAGLTLMHEAELSRNMTKLARACEVRNGLMMSLLAFGPIRLKNFATLEIGRSFVKIHGTWWIALSASETKEKRADERPIHELLTPLIDRYLAHYRPVLARSGNPPPVLWLSAKNGLPITTGQVARAINMTTLSTVGVAVSPHLFRTAAASSAAVHAGDNPYLGSAVLHHTDPRVTNNHYNRSTSLRAGESFRQIVRQYEKTSP